MPKTKSIQMLLLSLFLASGLTAQNVKFGKVSKQELEEKFYEKDSSAAAAVLYRKVHIYFSYTQNGSFHVIKEVYKRIKIYNKDGLDYANVAEKLYHGKSDKEDLSGLKGCTYNLENGKVVETKLKNSDSFSISLNKYYDQEKFAMPNVKEGSVIEYQYRIDSPFYYSIPEMALQYDIPIKKQEITIATPEYFVFKPSMKGYLPVNPKYGTSTGKLTFMSKTRTEGGGFSSTTTNFNNNSINYRINTTDFDMVDVPALKDEPYVNNINNYRASVDYELRYVQFPNSVREDYTSTWAKVIKSIYESDDFGHQLSASRYFKNDLPSILNGVTGNMEKAMAIFQYVQKRMAWNGYLGYFTDKGVRKAYDEKSGNTADINLMLIAMLKEAGFKVSPVLISTRDNGVPMFPTREGFNYVVAALELNDNTFLLDASNKYTKPNILPTRALNWFGKMVNEEGISKDINLFPKNASTEQSWINVTLNEDGDIEGKMRNIYKDYEAHSFRTKFNGVSKEDYLQKFENRNSGMEVSDYEIKNKEVIGEPIMENFDFYMENQLEIIGDNIYFSPLFYKTMRSNPFTLDKRNYPIDFAFPWEEKYLINIKVPEGYKVTSIPESINLALENNMGNFLYRIVEQKNIVQLVVDIKMNQPVIPATYYAGIKEFFKKIVEKETEKVVLSKI